MIVVFLLALLLASTAEAGVTVTRGPYLAVASSDAMTIRWRTSDPVASRVWLGLSPGALSPAATDTALTIEHELRLTGLVPGTRFYYAVGAGDQILASGDSLWFRPTAGAGATIRVWVLGDSGKPGYRQDHVRDAYYAFPGAVATDAVLLLGDNAYNAGTDDEFQAGLFVPYARFLRTHPFWLARGNHDDAHSGADNDYYELFTMPVKGESGGVPSGTEAWYSFECGEAHFICLDSQDSDRSPGSPQLAWLAADLAATTRRWIIAFWHHPPYSKGSHDSDADTRMTEMREYVMPILEAGGVDLVLSGHSHNYERSYLIDGHYGTSDTFLPSMKKDAGDGRTDGDGAYRKPLGRAPHAGEVMVVAGTASQDSPGPLDHPAMFTGYNGLGSVVLDISGTTLRARFLDDAGTVRDDFAIEKGIPISSPGFGSRLAISLAGANPVRGRVTFLVEGADEASTLSIFDVAGRRVGVVPVGQGAATWNAEGTAPGVYFAMLERGGARRVARIVLVQ